MSEEYFEYRIEDEHSDEQGEVYTRKEVDKKLENKIDAPVNAYDTIDDKNLILGSFVLIKNNDTKETHMVKASQFLAISDYSDQVEISEDTIVSDQHDRKLLIINNTSTLHFRNDLPHNFQCSVFASTGATVTFVAQDIRFVGNKGRVLLESEKTATIIKRNSTGGIILRGELS